MSYKSTRLLVENVNSKFDDLRKKAMSIDLSEHTIHDAAVAISELQGLLPELRELVDELAAKAFRTTLDDVSQLSPVDYVTTMKPIVAQYHRQLFTADLLPQCLCDDLKAAACVVILIGEESTIVRAAHDESKPEMEAAVEMVLASLAAGAEQAAADRAAGTPRGEERALLEEADRVGWDSSEGEALRERAKLIRGRGSVGNSDEPAESSKAEDPDPELGGESGADA